MEKPTENPVRNALGEMVSGILPVNNNRQNNIKKTCHKIRLKIYGVPWYTRAILIMR